MPNVSRIGIIGAGFIGRRAARRINATPGLEVSAVLTRRPVADVAGIPRELLTNSLDELIAGCDIVLEASGDAVYATDVLCRVADAGLPIVTMDSELHVTTGSYFASRCYITEADGDQPGATARLAQEVRLAGFSPLAYVNIKGFLNPDPSRKDMEYWAQRQGLALDQVVSFTDGSKLQIEQALVANGLCADLARDGMIGSTVEELKQTDHLAEAARQLGRPISDYVLCASAPPGVFILAESEEVDDFGDYGPTAKLRTAEGKAYLLLRPHHLCPLEIPRTLLEVAQGVGPLLNNGVAPHVGVGAVAKRAIGKGERIERALGSFEFRGMALTIAEHPDHVPICLMKGAVIRHALEPGQVVSFDDVELPDSRALEIYHGLRTGTLLPAADDAKPSQAASKEVHRRVFGAVRERKLKPTGLK